MIYVAVIVNYSRLQPVIQFRGEYGEDANHDSFIGTNRDRVLEAAQAYMADMDFEEGFPPRILLGELTTQINSVVSLNESEIVAPAPAPRRGRQREPIDSEETE